MREVEARQAAIKYIGLRVCSSGQVREKLISMGYDVETVENVIEELVQMQYIDDLRYARKHVKERMLLKPKSRYMLEKELEQKGVDNGIIHQVIEENDIDDFQLAVELAKKKFKDFDKSSDKDMRKLFSFLSYRGFDSNTVMKVSEIL